MLVGEGAGPVEVAGPGGGDLVGGCLGAARPRIARRSSRERGRPSGREGRPSGRGCGERAVGAASPVNFSRMIHPDRGRRWDRHGGVGAVAGRSGCRANSGMVSSPTRIAASGSMLLTSERTGMVGVWGAIRDGLGTGPASSRRRMTRRALAERGEDRRPVSGEPGVIGPEAAQHPGVGEADRVCGGLTGPALSEEVVGALHAQSLLVAQRCDAGRAAEPPGQGAFTDADGSGQARAAGGCR